MSDQINDVPINNSPYDVNLHNDIQAWVEQQAEYAADLDDLRTKIEQMAALAKKGGSGTEAAFQMAQNSVMPAAMGVQGSNMSTVATSMNNSSDMQAFATAYQNLINSGSSATVGTNGAITGGMTPQQGAQLVQYMKELYDAVSYELTLPPSQQWLDPATANSILQSLTTVSNEFEPGSNPDTLAQISGIGNTVAGDINTWTVYPTENSSGVDNNANINYTGQQHIQNIHGGIQQLNNTVSAQSQSLTTQEQFAGNVYQQYMQSLAALLKSAQQLYQMLAQNQKAS